VNARAITSASGLIRTAGEEVWSITEGSYPDRRRDAVVVAQELLVHLRKHGFIGGTMCRWSLTRPSATGNHFGAGVQDVRDRYVACYKQKYDQKGTPFDVIRTINKETAQGVLECEEFWSGLREIVR